MINYKILDESISYYEREGFKRIESPWMVTPAIAGITFPIDKLSYIVESKKKVLVGSAEQSFLYLYLKGFLPLGKFQSITPCFREDSFDITHTKYFIKNELIITDKVDREELIKVVNISKGFFESILLDEVNIKEDDKSYDLEYKGIELGSYGIRECDFLKWIYATGVAEPRLSTIVKKFNIK